MFFKVIKENLHNPETGFYTAFGIEAKDENSESRLMFISDVFLSESKALEFAELLNLLKPELVHFEELCVAEVEDTGNIFHFKE